MTKFPVIIEGEILHRATFGKETFLNICPNKAAYNDTLARIYTTVQEFPELTVTLMIRRANK
jgi:hypothetical protein